MQIRLLGCLVQICRLVLLKKQQHSISSVRLIVIQSPKPSCKKRLWYYDMKSFMFTVMYRRVSINKNIIQKFIYFSMGNSKSEITFSHPFKIREKKSYLISVFLMDSYVIFSILEMIDVCVFAPCNPS